MTHSLLVSRSPCLLSGFHLNPHVFGIAPGLLVPEPIAGAGAKCVAARPRRHKAGCETSGSTLTIAPAAIRQRAYLNIECSHAAHIIVTAPAHQEAAIGLPVRRCHA